MHQTITFNRRLVIRLVRQLQVQQEELPEHRFILSLLDRESRLCRLALFFAAQLSRRGNHAAEIYGLAAKLALDTPWLIDPADPRSADPIELAVLYGKGKIPRASNTRFGDPVEWWFNNMAILREQYDSDPFNLFVGLPVHKGWQVAKAELTRRHMQFQGVGSKVTALNVSQFQREILPREGQYWQRVQRLPFFAVDQHIMRLVRMWGIVTYWEDDKAKKLQEPISDYMSELCYRLRLSPASVQQAMWQIGSNHCGHMRRRRVPERARAYCHKHCPAVAYCLGVVPLHTIKVDGRTKWLAHLRYAEMVPHADL